MSEQVNNLKYSEGPSYCGGHYPTKTGNWRTFRPILETAKCKMCLICWVYCPEGAITRGESMLSIDYNYCKGCGICEKECKRDAIKMIRE